jgi:hypothetical protein
LEARQLLEEFVKQADAGKVMPRMLQHMHACVAAYLAGKRTLLPAPKVGRYKPYGVTIATLDKAFGLKRATSGAPPVDDDTLTEVAVQVLQRRIAGASLETASGAVAEYRKEQGLNISSESQVREAWADHQQSAVVLLRIARCLSGGPDPWTQTEIDRLNELFFGNEWFCPPGADVQARAAAIRAEYDDPDQSPETLKARVRAAMAKYDAPFAPKISKDNPA